MQRVIQVLLMGACLSACSESNSPNDPYATQGPTALTGSATGTSTSPGTATASTAGAGTDGTGASGAGSTSGGVTSTGWNTTGPNDSGGTSGGLAGATGAQTSSTDGASTDGASTDGASTATAMSTSSTGGVPTMGVPCGDGWGTAPIPGSTELGLASAPEIAGVPGGLPEERDIFDQINAERAAVGLEPLLWSEQVANVARSHAADMNQLDYFDHGSLERPYRDAEGNAISDNWLPRPRLEFVYPGDFARAGENIASYPNPVANVVEAWMNSDGHRAAILDEYGWTATHGAVGLDGNIAVFSPATCAR